MPGPPRHGLVYLVDMSGPAEQRRSAQRQAQMLEAAQTLAAVGSWAKDDADAPLQWSSSLRALVGLPDSVVSTRELWTSLVDPADRGRLADLATCDDDEAGPLDVRLQRWDGGHVVVEARTRRLVPGSGASGAYVGSARDVTAERRAMQQLSRSEEWRACSWTRLPTRWSSPTTAAGSPTSAGW